jgi:hypothetical protein
MPLRLVHASRNFRPKIWVARVFVTVLANIAAKFGSTEIRRIALLEALIVTRFGSSDTTESKYNIDTIGNLQYQRWKILTRKSVRPKSAAGSFARSTHKYFGFGSSFATEPKKAEDLAIYHIQRLLFLCPRRIYGQRSCCTITSSSFLVQPHRREEITRSCLVYNPWQC